MDIYHTLRLTVLRLVFLTVLLSCSTYESTARERVVLSNTKPISAQIMPTDKGAIYIVSETIDLGGEKMKLPEGAILQFDGGMLLNGEIVGNNATIVAGRYEIFKNVSITGCWSLNGIPVEWFGAVANNASYDCSDAINMVLLIGAKINAPALLGSGVYYTKSTIDMAGKGTLIGLSSALTTICYDANAKIGVFMHKEYNTLRDICIKEKEMERKGICVKLGDKNNLDGCRRGYVENIKTMGGDCGLDLEYQWCNKISGVNSRKNNTGLYAGETTPYVENAVIEGNFKYGVFSEGSGIKLYNAIIEGNNLGCVLNGKYNMLNNCYFESNSESYLNKNAAKDSNGKDVVGGNLFVGEKEQVIDLIMIGCRFANSSKYNKTIRVDKCQNLNIIGCHSMEYLEMTKNCTLRCDFYSLGN